MDETGFWIIILGLTAVTFFPSVLLYGFVAWCVFKFCRSWNPLYLIVAIAPFASWYFERTAGEKAIAADEAAIAAIELQPLPIKMPDTIVFERHYSNLQDIKAMGLFRYVVFNKTDWSPHVIEKYDLLEPSRERRPTTLSALPTVPYISLKVGRASEFWDDGRVKAAGGGPYELRYVSPTRDDLVALKYRPFVRVPTFPPILGISGWSFGGNSTSQKVSDVVLDFLEVSLKDKPQNQIGSQ